MPSLIWKVWVELPLFEILGTRSISDFGIFWVSKMCVAFTNYASLIQASEVGFSD